MAIIQSIHVDHVAIGDVEVNVVVAAVVVVMVVYLFRLKAGGLGGGCCR